MTVLIVRAGRLGRAVAGLSGWRRYGLAAALGAVGAAALPPAHAVFLLVPAFTGLAWLIAGAGTARRPARAAFAAGWWFGFGYFVAGLYWLSLALLTDAERFGWLVPFAVPSIAAGLALFCGAASLAVHLSRARGVGLVLALAVAWTAADWLRGVVLTGFPWNLVGTAWAYSDSMIQATALTGIHGLGLLTVAVAAAPAVLDRVTAVPGDAGRRAIRVLAAAAAAVALVWAGGALRLGSAPPLAAAAMVPGVQLRLVQANIFQNHKWRADLRAANLSRHLSMTVAPGFEEATHVIWPETAAPFVLTADAERRAAVAAVAAVAPPGGLLITGAPRMTAARDRIWNSLVAIDEAAAIVGVYDKFHLVPFGEYVPLRDWVGIAKLTHGAVEFSAGPGPRTLRLPGLPPVSPLICYEVIFPGRVLDAEDRPDWLLNITNDAWFGISAGPYQHFAAARLRAVEEGLPLVRVANTGISAVVDPYGRVVASLGLGRRGVVDSPLPLPLAGLTPYAALGDWGLLLLLAVTALGAVYFSRTT